MEVYAASQLQNLPAHIGTVIEPVVYDMLFVLACMYLVYQLVPAQALGVVLFLTGAAVGACVWTFAQIRADNVVVKPRGPHEVDVSCQMSASTWTTVAMIVLYLRQAGINQPTAIKYMQYGLLRFAPLRLHWPQSARARHLPCVYVNHHLYTDILTRRNQRSCNGEACNYGHHKGWDQFFGGNFATACMLDIYILFMHMRQTYTIMQAANIGIGATIAGALNQALKSVGCKPRDFASMRSLDKRLWGAVEVPQRNQHTSSSVTWWRTFETIQTNLQRNQSYAFVMYPRGNVLSKPCVHHGDSRRGWPWNFAEAEAQKWESNGVVRAGYPAQDCLSFYASSPIVVAVTFGMQILLPLTLSRHGRVDIRMVDIQPNYKHGKPASELLAGKGGTDPTQSLRTWKWPNPFAGTTAAEYDQYRDRIRIECQHASRLLYSIVRRFHDEAFESL